MKQKTVVGMKSSEEKRNGSTEPESQGLASGVIGDLKIKIKMCAGG